MLQATTAFAIAAAVLVAKSGLWETKEQIDLLTDEPSVTFYRESSLAQGAGSVGFGVHCARRNPTFVISWRKVIRGPEHLVHIRIDEKKPKAIYWIRSSNYLSSVWGGKRSARGLLKRLAKAETLTVRAQSVDGPLTAVFGLRGLSEALAGHEDACGIG